MLVGKYPKQVILLAGSTIICSFALRKNKEYEN